MTRRLTWCWLFLAAALFAPPGCVLGSEQNPGCRAGHPEDCGSGYVCRAGACLRYSTEAGPAGSDAASDAGNEAASDAPADRASEPAPANDAASDAGSG